LPMCTPGIAGLGDIESRVFAEDVPIVESLDPAESPLGPGGQAHVRADRYSVAYRRMFAELIESLSGDQETSRRPGLAAGDRPGVDAPHVPA
jgi:hypothetical protein